MTQLIENRPPRRALIATLLHFSPSEGFALITPLLIDRGYQLEIDVTPAGSSQIQFLIVAERKTARTGNRSRKQVSRRPCGLTWVAGRQRTLKSGDDGAEIISIELIQSSRRRITGSSDRARCAGIHVARRPSNAIAKTTPANTSGSRGVAWYTMEASTRLARMPRSNPATETEAINLNGSPSAACTTSLGCAPRAIRIPNSRLRLLTEYAAKPKMPVTDSIAPRTPSTPSESVAMREGNSALSSSWFQVRMVKGSPASRSVNLLLIAATNCCASLFRPTPIWLDPF